MKKLPLLLLTAAVAACDYLDVIPPEQQTLDDTMKDATAVESWLYSCYGEAPYMSRIEYLCSTDELSWFQAMVCPKSLKTVGRHHSSGRTEIFSA